MNCGCPKAQAGINAAGAAARIVQAIVTGSELLVSAEVRAERLAACLQCPKMSPSKSGAAHRCNACGCWLDGKRLCKICLTTETCPLNHWKTL